MSMNLEALRAKLEKLKNPQKGGGRDFGTWRPKDGDNQIRFIKYPYSEDPFIELWFHYNIGNSSVLCPKRTKGMKCPICSFSDQLWKSKEPADQELNKRIRAKQRFYAVVVDRADNTMTPKYWGFGKEIYQKLLENLFDEDYQNYLDTSAGKDAIVTSKKDPKMQFPTVDLRSFKAKDTPLAASAAETQKVLSNIKRIEEVFKILEPKEIEQKLNEMLIPKDEETVEAMSSEKFVSAPVQTSAVSTEDLNSDVDSAFDNVL